MRGGSQAHLMRCSDESYYVIKFRDNPQGTRILMNDLLATGLAARLGLPTMPVAICYVSQRLIELTEDLHFEMAHSRVPCQPGLHFGSHYADPHHVTVHDFIPDSLLRRVTNIIDFAGMLVFDKWTCNTDGRQTLFLQDSNELGEIGEMQYATVMIDQGFCFNAGEWNFPDAPLRGLYTRRVVYEHVHGIEDFEPWIERLESRINEAVLTEVAKTIPPEWYESDSDALQRLLERLERRRTKVRELIWDTWRAAPNAFPNWLKD